MSQSEELKAGLVALGPSFSAEICGWCDGAGEYRQTYTAGCGGGSFQSMGHCERCRPKDKYFGLGHGLMINGKPAPESVVNQVIRAAITPPAGEDAVK